MQGGFPFEPRLLVLHPICWQRVRSAGGDRVACFSPREPCKPPEHSLSEALACVHQALVCKELRRDCALLGRPVPGVTGPRSGGTSTQAAEGRVSCGPGVWPGLGPLPHKEFTLL